MPRIPLRFPVPGESKIADEIRKRRHPRDLISLDGVLLHNPSIANGWNSLIGPIRSENSLPADIRELLILRVAALNSAAYEWVQHETIARAAGMSTTQLCRVRDIVKPLSDPHHQLSPSQITALAFADAVTRTLDIPDELIEEFKQNLGGPEPDRALLDATTTVAAYNMVSRVLITLDVADDKRAPVPLPGLVTTHHRLTMRDGTELEVCTRAVPADQEPGRPWIVFVNSLLVEMSMWEEVLPSFAKKFNLLCFDQRGHGKSAVPPEPCTIEGLVEDVTEIVTQLGLSVPIHGIIGVSQGGATALGLAAHHPDLFEKLVVCDSQPASPNISRSLWEARLGLKENQGSRHLAEVTVQRWFPSASGLHLPESRLGNKIRRMVEHTSLEGFRAGCAALCDYKIDESKMNGTKILLVAGEEDGKLPEVLKGLGERIGARYENVPGAGHLPMVDQPAGFLKASGIILGVITLIKWVKRRW
ncbi:hydrolase/acyltransferase [Melampsora larici-populina 98AG31]|uniref:Hydrolase/acyltransferase n=1 Tax=Melampsora larici-populina (strain 98AG31 / pathotype 3-4-7) TaxID=747676 RepID=F4R641_MELLP|nr:hydrolase/acyltransferase [Melampsora larici-populina 98AG31]EGG12535.1 hydrolase/acyltransferase [Melampsora larici-populina 98AG31]